MNRQESFFGYSLVTFWLMMAMGCDVTRTPPPEHFDVGIGESLKYGPVTRHFDEGGQVTVEVSAAWLDDQWAVVRAVFTPAEKGFHLYSKDLPRKGLDGIGRPTLIDAAKSVKRSGELTANREAVKHESFGKSYPVYPDGPVTLYRLVVPEGNEISVKLTCMTCSAEYCKQPVENAEVAVTLPSSD